MESSAIAWWAVAAAAGFFLSLAFTVWVIVRLPEDHFASPRRRPTDEPPTPAGVLRRVVRNLAGALAVLLGVFLAVPGVPGQGLLMILVGIILMDFPGKYRLELALIRREPVRRAVNGLRARLGRPPLKVCRPGR